MKEYTVIIGGIEHTLLLSDEEAKAKGLIATKAADKPANKAAAAPVNKVKS